MSPEFWIAGTMGVALAAVGVVGSNRRQVVAGLLLAAVAALAAMMARGGTLPRSRSYLIVAPGVSVTATRRLAERLAPDAGRRERIVRSATLMPALSGGGPRGESFVGKRWLADAAVAARPGWWSWALDGFPRPTVVVPYDGSDFWRVPDVAAGAGVDDPTVVAAAFRDAGAELRVVDVADGDRSAGAGRLSVALSSPRIGVSNYKVKVAPLTCRALVHARLEGCPYPAIKDSYSIRAWVDRRWPVGAAAPTWLLVYPPPPEPPGQPKPLPVDEDGQLAIDLPADAAAEATEPPHEHIRLGVRPEEARQTTLSFSKFGPKYPSLRWHPVVGQGFHRLDIDLIFEALIDGVVVPLTYSATKYFEVTETSLVLLHDSSRDLATRHTWTHRPGSSHIAGPDSDEALDLLLNNQDIRWSRPNYRMPFAGVMSFDLVHWVDQHEQAEAAVARASMVMLVDPTWEQVKAVAPVLSNYVDKCGGTVMTALPPEPKSGEEAQVPSWLPAVGAPVGDTLDEYAEPRVYFLLDASRPASKFATAEGTQFGIGGRLQADVVNKVYKALGATDRAGARITDALVGPAVGQADVAVAPAAATVALIDVGGRVGLVVPPLIARLDTSKAALTGSAYTPSRDVASSWISRRLWTLNEPNRGLLYQTALNPLRAPTGPRPDLLPNVKWQRPDRLPTCVFDAPLLRSAAHRGSVVVAFALDVRQPGSHEAVWDPNWGGSVWMTADARADVSAAHPTVVSPATLETAGATLIVVPIRLSDRLAATYSTVISTGDEGTLDQAVKRWKGQLLQEANGTRVDLDLSGDDDKARTSATAVATRLSQVVREYLNRPAAQLVVRDGGRAIDARVKSPTNAPRVWRRMRIVAQDGVTPPPAAVITGAGDEAPAIVWRPLAHGAAIALAYSPVAHDMWYRDGGPSFVHLSTVDSSMAPVSDKPDGWGLQRLCDPIALAAGAPTRPLTIDQVRVSVDETSLLLDCSLTSSAVPTDLPELIDEAGQPAAAVVSIADLNVAGRRVTLSISPKAKEKAFDGYVTLKWVAGLTAGPVFVRLRAADEPARRAREALATVAGLSGGRAVPEHLLASTLEASFSAAWVGTTGLIVVVALTLSPLARRWSPLPRWRRRRRNDLPVMAREDSASLEAAFDATGTSLGTPAAQRPAGRQLQVRVMRPGDPPVSARRSDWAYFVPEIADQLGSPPLPRVIETPRLEALSILTLIDWHPGAGARDSGQYEDRIRAMARVATLNALVASRRGGLHHVLSLQGDLSRDAVEPAPPDETAMAVERLARAANLAGGRRALPELLPGEAVVLVTNPATDVDTYLGQLARRCVEERCPLGVVLLTHPMQRDERGLMRRPDGGLTGFHLLDRNDMDPVEVDAYLLRRSNALAALADIADGRVCALRTDQPVGELVVLLTESLWEAC